MNEHADSLPVTEPTGIVGGLVNTPFLSIRASVCHSSTGLVEYPLLKLGYLVPRYHGRNDAIRLPL